MSTATVFEIEEVKEVPGQQRLYRVNGTSRLLLCQHGGGMQDCIEKAKNYRAEKPVVMMAGSGLPEARMPQSMRSSFAQWKWIGLDY